MTDKQLKHIQIVKSRLGERFESRCPIIDFEEIEPEILKIGKEIFSNYPVSIITEEQCDDKFLSTFFAGALKVQTNPSLKNVYLYCNFTYSYNLLNPENSFLSVTKEHLHSFENGTVFTDTICQRDNISAPVTKEDLITELKNYFLFMKDQMDKAIEEEKTFTPGEIITLDGGVSKQEIRKGLYKFSRNDFFILKSDIKEKIPHPEKKDSWIFFENRLVLFYDAIRYGERNEISGYGEYDKEKFATDDQICSFLWMRI